VKLLPVIVMLAPGRPLVGLKPVTLGVTLKFVLLAGPLPALFITMIGPVLAPTGTVALIIVELLTVKLPAPTLTPLNCTSVAPVKVTPVIVTLAPTGPLVGVNDETFGVTPKLLLLVNVPLEFVTVIGPVVVPLATVACIIPLTNFTLVAVVPFIFTVLVEAKPVPVMVMTAPTGPLVGVKLPMPFEMVKLVVLVPVPDGLVMLIGPVVAVAGTVAVICVSLLTTNPLPGLPALTPLNFTAVAPVKLAPIIVTLAPTGPLVGLKLVIVGDVVTDTPPSCGEFCPT
jgi:hypothetical protein